MCPYVIYSYSDNLKVSSHTSDRKAFNLKGVSTILIGCVITQHILSLTVTDIRTSVGSSMQGDYDWVPASAGFLSDIQVFRYLCLGGSEMVSYSLWIAKCLMSPSSEVLLWEDWSFWKQGV